MKLAIAEQRRRAAAFAAKHCAHARQQFANLERLYQIVVRAEIEAVDAVINTVPRGYNDDRKLAAERAKPAQHLSAIRQREPKIEQRYLVGLTLRNVDGGLAIGHPIHRIGCIPKRLLDSRAYHLVVIDQQNPHFDASFSTPRLIPSYGTAPWDTARRARLNSLT